jgi:hypothetical protein
MPDFIRTILTQKPKPSFGYVKVFLSLYVFALVLFVVGMLIATIWH